MDLHSAVALALPVAVASGPGVAPLLRIAPGMVSAASPDVHTAIAVPLMSGLAAPVWVDAKALAHALTTLGPTADVRPGKGHLAVSAGKASIKVATRDTGMEWTDAPESDGIDVDAASFGSAIDRVIAAAAGPNNPARITGVHMAGTHMVTTDGHRMHVTPIACPSIESVIGQPMCQAIQRLADSVGGPMRIAVTTSLVSVTCGDVRLRGPMVADPFVGWRMQVELCDKTRLGSRGTCKRKATVDRDAMLEAIKIARVPARTMRIDKSTGEPGVSIAISGDEMVVASADESARASCPVEGQCAAVHAAPAYLVDALSSLPDGPVEMHTGGELDPIVFAVGDEWRLVMPRRK